MGILDKNKKQTENKVAENREAEEAAEKEAAQKEDAAQKTIELRERVRNALHLSQKDASALHANFDSMTDDEIGEVDSAFASGDSEKLKDVGERVKSRAAEKQNAESEKSAAELKVFGEKMPGIRQELLQGWKDLNAESREESFVEMKRKLGSKFDDAKKQAEKDPEIIAAEAAWRKCLNEHRDTPKKTLQENDDSLKKVQDLLKALDVGVRNKMGAILAADSETVDLLKKNIAQRKVIGGKYRALRDEINDFEKNISNLAEQKSDDLGVQGDFFGSNTIRHQPDFQVPAADIGTGRFYPRDKFDGNTINSGALWAMKDLGVDFTLEI